MYIVFEGIIGTGKTTLSKKLYDYLKEKYPRKEVIWTREPGGTEIAQKIRECVQGTNFNEDMDPICEAYLYAASRAQSLRTIVKPIIEKGGIAIADRSFITSMANQGYGRELGVKRALKINEPAVEGIHPDLVVFLDVDPKIAITRVYDSSGDKFERFGIDFYRRLRCGYKKISKMKMFRDKWLNVKMANVPIEQNFNLILRALKPYLKKFNL